MTAKALRFTRVRLINWRNFRKAEMRLAARAFIVGPNASGKSNLLDALRFLGDLAKPTGGLATALSTPSRGGFGMVRCHIARVPSHIGIDVDVGTDDEPARWTYRLQIQKYRGEDAAVQSEHVLHGGKRVAEQVRPEKPRYRLLYSQTLLEQVHRSIEFQELVEFFASIRYLHVVPQMMRNSRRSLSVDEDAFGADLVQRIATTPKKTREPRLRRIQEALAIAVPQFGEFGELELMDDSEGRPHLYAAAYGGWRPNAPKHSEEVFSDGTLRLIGFLWSITERGGPLLLEEPELSLNDAIVQQLPRMMARAQRLSGRQVIATTHSSVMLDAPGIGLDEVHRLVVTDNGTEVETAADNPKVVAQVTEGGWTAGQAVLPLTQPKRINELGTLDVVGR